MFKQSTLDRISNLRKLYATPRGCVMPALSIVETDEGDLTPERQKALASFLEVPVYQVGEAATFYTMYNTKGRGRQHLQLCKNISCYLRGADAVIKRIEDRLQIKPGEVSVDGEFELELAECLGDCDHAPCGILGKEPLRDLTVEKIDELLNSLGAPKHGL